jgi:predicted HicB family RNase H-like nuclease
MDELRAVIYDVVSKNQPMTVRQVFYQLVSLGAIGKTENEYKSTVVRLLGLMRREHELPFNWIADNTRWMRKPRTYSGMKEALEETVRTYRRALWDEQNAYVEVWLEQDALAGILYEETWAWDVPLMVARGYSSLPYLYEAAQVIQHCGKSTYLYYFGDLDPSGLDITRVVEKDIRGFAPGAEVYFERVAVTSEQIARWKLPTRPTKKTDSRSKGFKGESVELDAIPPRSLRELAATSITKHIEPMLLDSSRRTEKAERKSLKNFLKTLQAALDLGQDIPVPSTSQDYGGKIALRLPRSLHRRAAELADREGVSLNQFLVAAIAEKVGATTIYTKIVQSLEQRLFRISIGVTRIVTKPQFFPEQRAVNLASSAPPITLHVQEEPKGVH